MEILPETYEQLAARLEILERRIEALEALGHSSALPGSPSVEQASATPTAEAGEALLLAQSGGIFSVLGKAMLGIAGAYVLRAVAESGSLPKLAIAVVAIAYAILWLVWATRIPVKAWVTGVIYACTSALILAPMLWELTLSFKVLAAPATAAILGLYVIVASALAWKRDRVPVFWVANMTAVITALGLSIATHELLPFIAALLLMALISEYAAARNHERSIRPWVAAAVDLAIWALIFIYAGPQGARADYPAIDTAGLLLPPCLLFLVYAASIAIRTTFLEQTITVFETGQATIAFLLAAWSVLTFEPRADAVVLGAVCLLLSVVCYTGVFLLFSKVAEARNYHVFASWAVALLLAGSLLSLPPFWLATFLGLAAIVAVVVGARRGRLTLEFHGLAYLAAAAIVSGLLKYAFDSLAGALSTGIVPRVWIVSVCAIACYAAEKSGPSMNWKRQLLRLLPAALAASAVTAFLVGGLLRLAALSMAPEAHHIAFVRTLILCAAALALAFGGFRWRRVELTRIAYAALVLIAGKLLFEDLRLGHLAFIAASIFLFAVTLIAVPRLTRMGQKA